MSLSHVRQQDVGENETTRMIRTNDEREGREVMMSEGETRAKNSTEKQNRKWKVEKRHGWKMMKLEKKLDITERGSKIHCILNLSIIYI